MNVKKKNVFEDSKHIGFQRNVRQSLNVFQSSTEISHTFGRLSMSPDPVEWGEEEKNKVLNERRECANGWKTCLCLALCCVSSVTPNEPFI